MDASERRKRAAQEAAEWWVRLQGEVPRAEREQYVDWLRESALHVAEMLRVAQVHGALAQFERWSKLPPEGGGTDTTSTDSGTVVSLPSGDASPSSAATNSLPKPPNQTPRRSMLVWATAASILIAAGIGAYLLLATRGQVIETQRGERREVALADGSAVQVDPETRIRIDYQADSRRVYLERGRALFHVAKNPHWPFLVQAYDTTVRAVGTAFAVEQALDAVVVTVAEGKVAVIPAHPRSVDRPGESGETARTVTPETAVDVVTVHAAANSAGKATGGGDLSTAATPSGVARDEIFLTANEQVTVAGSGTAEPIREVDSRRELAWAEGRLIFERQLVEYAVQEFNRYNRIQITVNDAALAHRPISGVFSASDPESFVAFIQTVAPVRVTRDAAADISINAAK
jgi:transmembrane sensor